VLRTDTAKQIPETMVRIELPAWKCERCEHVWVPRSMDVEPRVCPKCKSPYWNRPRRKDASKVAD
jgi:Zn finger protein HypA/HybF involved in hydrogenase expression